MNVYPKISVVVPTHNRELTVGYSLLSVVNQTYANLEIIVADDCSNDSTVDVVEKVADSRIRIIQHENKRGAQAARNTAIRNAGGDWITFLDSDDEWVQNKLERQVDILRNHEFREDVVIYTDFIEYYPKTGSRNHFRLKSFSGEKAYHKLLQEPGPMFQGLMVSKKMLEKIGLLDENVPSYQEWDTSIRLAENGYFVHLNEPLFVYYLEHGEAISRNKKREIEGYDYVVRKNKNKIQTLLGKRAWNRHIINQIDKCLNFGFYDQAMKYLTEVRGLILLEERLALLIRCKHSTIKRFNIPRQILRGLKKLVRKNI